MAPSIGCSPALPSTTKRIRSASSTAVSTCCRIAWSIGACESGTRPPVSTSQNFRPFHSPSPKCRSRVVPASADTIAFRPPWMRLKSVDFPTLGRPTMATVGWLTH